MLFYDSFFMDNLDNMTHTWFKKKHKANKATKIRKKNTQEI